MCDPFLIGAAMAGTGIAGSQMSARATNEASRKNAEAMIAQSNAEQAGIMIRNALEGADLARESFSQGLQREEMAATQNVAFGEGMGRVYNDYDRAKKVEWMDADYYLQEVSQVRAMKTQEAMWQTHAELVSRIESLPRVSKTQQFVDAAGHAVQGYAYYYQTDAMLKSGTGSSKETPKKTGDT